MLLNKLKLQNLFLIYVITVFKYYIT